MSIESSGVSANPSLKDEWWTPRLAGPVIAAAALRFTLLAVALARMGTSALISPDTNSYLIPGRNLILHGCFCAEGAPDLLRTPGYPLFLGLFSFAGLPAAAVANVILSVFIVILVWRLGRLVSGDDRIALVAAWIFAFEPLSVGLSAVLLSEMFFLALFLLCLERLAGFLRRRHLWMLAQAGVWLAAATFVRPVTYYLPLALALGLFLVLARVPGLRWKAPAVLLIGVLPWLAAWQIRNKIETGYGGFTSVTEINLYFFEVAQETARADHRPFLEVQKELGYSGMGGQSGQTYLAQTYILKHPEQSGWSQGQRLAFMHSEALRVIRAHSGAYFRARLIGLIETIFSPGTGYFDHALIPPDSRPALNIVESGSLRWGIEIVKTYPWIAVEKAVFAAVVLGLYLFAGWGVFRGGIHGADLWLLLGTLLYFLAITTAATGTGADARYQLPIMPIVCIFAAAGARRAKTIAR